MALGGDDEADSVPCGKVTNAVPLLEDQFVVGFFDEDLEETTLEFDPDAMDRRLEVVGEMLILGRQGQGQLQSQFQREGLSLAVDGANVDANLEVVGIAHGESPYWNYGGSSCVFSPIRLSQSLPQAQVTRAPLVLILCSLRWIAHQLASARDFLMSRVERQGESEPLL